MPGGEIAATDAHESTRRPNRAQLSSSSCRLPGMPLPRPMLSEELSTHGRAKRTSAGGSGVSSEDANRRGKADLSYSCSDRRISSRLDQRENRVSTISFERTSKGPSRSDLGLPDLQHSAVATTELEAKTGTRLTLSSPRDSNPDF